MTTPTPTSLKRQADSPLANPNIKKQKDDEANDILDGLNAKQVEIYKRNATESPLLRLPAEVRNRIYHHAIGCNNTLPFRLSHSEPVDLFAGTYGKQKSMENWDDLFTLTLVCRQLHSETTVLPWKLNTFEVGFECDFNAFVNLLSDEKKNLIKTVAFGVKRDCPVWWCGTRRGLPMELYNCNNVKKLICSKDYPSTNRAAVEMFAGQQGLRFEIDD